jgi:Skp family chaperone for outer membrane proteins
MMRRFFVAVTLLLLLPMSACADWHQREAAIMGTRITAGVWHEDSTAGQAALDAVFAEMHTELNDSELERKLIARIRMFRFETRTSRR